ncbi:MAG: malate dehydrogenase (quinone), partial [Corynebacterium propinquum]
MSKNPNPKPTDDVDIVLIGGGIMSATLGAMLRELEPSWSQMVFERLDAPAMESSSPWNNAGTGHSALCELNYTPEKNGTIDLSKAVGVNEKFQISRQFWAHQLNNGILSDPKQFINKVPHVSFGKGTDQVGYIERRFEALRDNHMFPDMKFTDDREEFAEKLPVMASGRNDNEKVAISWTDKGTDINFGALTKQFFTAAKAAGTEMRYGHEVKNLTKDGNKWKVTVKNLHTGDTSVVKANFVFVGAGGYALDLLRKAGLSEVHGYAGFPVSGLWLRSTNPDLIENHSAKVYGQAMTKNAPPMSVPHLDTRVVDGKTSLLFGPYAGFTTKFLKYGSFLDLPLSVRPNNLGPMLAVARDNMDLTRYLIKEVMQSETQRLETLRGFYPKAKAEDWRLEVAGQRVQIIKKDSKNGGILQFGTELVAAADGTI